MPPWRKLMNLASVLTLVSWSLSWLQLFVHLSSLPGLQGFLSSHPESLFCDAHESHYFCCFHLWILSTLGFKAILSPWWPLLSVHSQSCSQIRLPWCSRPLTSPAAFHSDDLRNVSAANFFTPSSPWSPWFPLILFLEHLSRCCYCSVTFSKSRFELCGASSAPKPSMVSCSLQNSYDILFSLKKKNVSYHPHII